MTTKLLGGAASPPSSQIAPLVAEMVPFEACLKIFGLGKTKGYELVRGRVLPTVKVGRRRYVRLDTARRVFAGLEHTGTHREEAA
jgi:hypothetical protein